MQTPERMIDAYSARRKRTLKQLEEATNATIKSKLHQCYFGTELALQTFVELANATPRIITFLNDIQSSAEAQASRAKTLALELKSSIDKLNKPLRDQFSNQRLAFEIITAQQQITQAEIIMILGGLFDLILKHLVDTLLCILESQNSDRSWAALRELFDFLVGMIPVGGGTVRSVSGHLECGEL